MSSRKSRVLIIGAGAAGIAAATRLLAGGIDNVLVLEAEDRIGGRIHSVGFDGSLVDLGAEWCHGEKGNIVFDMVKHLNLLEKSFNDYTNNTFCISDGTIIKNSMKDSIELANDIFYNRTASGDIGDTLGDYFNHEYRKRVGDMFPENRDISNMSEMLLDWFHKSYLDLVPAKTLFEVSMMGHSRHKKCEGYFYWQWKKKGYLTILNVLMKKIPDAAQQLPIDDKIFFNKEVNRIEWDRVDGVIVGCSDGSRYQTDHVIVTVSLGVLKSLGHLFTPKLPLFKQDAINLIGMGTVAKIFLKFPVKWWPDDVAGFSFLWTKTDRNNLLEEFPHGPSDHGKSWLEEIYGFYVVDNHPTVLLGWNVGKMVEQVEHLPDHILTEGCYFLLKKFLGHRYNVTYPNGLLRSKWKTNPHFNGSYTYPSLEAERRNVTREDLGRPVCNSDGKPVLLFAGEATHSKFNATVHGAIETGFNEADRILEIRNS